MGIDTAIKKAWSDLEKSAKPESVKLRFFGDDYLVDLNEKQVIKISDELKLKDYHSLLVLHYLLNEHKAAQATGEWISFKDLEGGDTYYSVFRKRAIEPIIKKYGDNPEGLFKNIDKVDGRKLDMADAAVEIKAFEKVPLAVVLWKPDEEFAAEANILFKENIKEIFCTEDVAVLSEIAKSKL